MKNLELKTSSPNRSFSDAYVVKGRGVGHLDVSRAAKSESFRNSTKSTLDKIDRAFPKESLAKS